MSLIVWQKLVDSPWKKFQTSTILDLKAYMFALDQEVALYVIISASLARGQCWPMYAQIVYYLALLYVQGWGNPFPTLYW
jgi:hypothetical protein